MTWTLVREQLRAQRGFVVAALSMVTAVVALATFAALASTTQGVVNERDDVLDRGYEFGMELPVEAASYAHADSSVRGPEEIDAAVVDATAAGDAFAVTAFLERTATSDGTRATVPLSIEAHGGDVAWAPVVRDGAAPAEGEILLTQDASDGLEAGIGDTVTIVAGPLDGGGEQAGRDMTMRVSGIAHGAGAFPVEVRAPEAHVAWDEFLPLSHTQSGHSGIVRVGWDRGSEPWEAISQDVGWATLADQGIASNTTSFVVGALAAAVALAALAAAFSTGRAQAQSRASWVGTARALGATRASVVRAGLVEMLVVGLVGTVLGWGLGWLLLTASLALEGAGPGAPAVPATPTVHTWTVLVPVAAGWIVAAVVALAPVLWARAVTPASALQPRPLGEHERGRRPLWVHVAVLAGAAALSLTTEKLAYDQARRGAIPVWATVAEWVAWAIAAATLMVLAARLTRWLLRRAAHRLGASSRVWAIGAAESIGTRPRAGVTAGVTMMPWGFVAAAVLVFAVGPATANPLNQTVATVLMLGGTGLMAVAIAVVADTLAVRSHGEDWSTMAALGLAPSVIRATIAVRFACSAICGVVAGAVGGAALVLAFVEWSQWRTPMLMIDLALWQAVAVIVGVVAVGACALAAGAALRWTTARVSNAPRRNAAPVG